MKCEGSLIFEPLLQSSEKKCSFQTREEIWYKEERRKITLFNGVKKEKQALENNRKALNKRVATNTNAHILYHNYYRFI